MNIVVAEHDSRLRARLAEALRNEGHTVTQVAACRDAMALVREASADLVLCDLGYPATQGLDFLTECRASDHDVLVIVMGPRGDDESALESMRRGAYDYIPKPFRVDHAVLVVRKAIEQEELRREVQRLRDELQRARMSGRRLTPSSTHATSATPSTVRALNVGMTQPAVRPPALTPTSRAATPGSLARIDEDLSVKRRKAALERTLIRRALERTGGNRTRAARLLDLSHRALLYKIREYGLAG